MSQQSYLTAIQSKLNTNVSGTNTSLCSTHMVSCSAQDMHNDCLFFFFYKNNSLFNIYIEAKIGQQLTTDEQDFIHTLGFELLSLCNEAWHMLHAASIEAHRITQPEYVAFHKMK